MREYWLVIAFSKATSGTLSLLRPTPLAMEEPPQASPLRENQGNISKVVEEFGSTSSRCAFARMRDRRGRKLWTVSDSALAETAENNSNDAFYNEVNALMSKIPSQQVVIVGVDANAKMGLEQQSDALGKW
ncbi:hypothetical protein RB195_008794 [Necator americanus]|uniref:Uncharacterized protein n=1 Tax=Necator americanus TaxID=51031 RepID=A0ABR1CRT9_NECAM